MIPKIIFQTGKYKDNDFIKHYSSKYPSYEYVFFGDSEALSYFEKNKIDEFHNISEQFTKLRGPHKADLLRYYWLYINGGIYMDTDIELVEHPETISMLSNEFIGVKTNNHKAFNGFIACVPKHEIIYKALQNIYSIDTDNIPGYGYFCEQLSVYFKENNSSNKLILIEHFKPNYQTHIIDKNNTLLMIHYYSRKHRAKQNLIRSSDVAFEQALKDVFSR